MTQNHPLFQGRNIFCMNFMSILFHILICLANMYVCMYIFIYAIICYLMDLYYILLIDILINYNVLISARNLTGFNRNGII